jgi:DNA-binding winged helix-turn-helix (wHTH) protein/TolB-like protein
MEAPGLLKRVYRFGLFQLDPDRGTLLRHGLPVRLQDQPLRVLCLLLQRPGEIITREELRQSLWPDGTYVEFDGSLNAVVKRLRFALGDDAENPVFIETVPKRGYRFIAPVECEQPFEVNRAAKEATRVEPQASPTAGAEHPSIARRQSWTWWLAGSLAVLILLTAWRYLGKNSPRSPATEKVIAVLPFSNEGAGPDLDYLCYAIANDLITDLSHVRSVTVRPFASTSRYGSKPADPAKVGKELQVTHVVAGGFLLENDNLDVTMELVDVARNVAVWRDEISVPPQELMALRTQLALRTGQGLLPAIHISSGSLSIMPRPRNERAFRLYLHSIGISHDPVPNLIAIKNLERSVSLDSHYAPAWDELCSRYYIDYEYGRGGTAARAKAIEAYQHAVELDPNGTENIIPIRAEQGELTAAYDEAASLLRRRPDSAVAHYAMSYVLRYAGLLDEAGRQCDAALAIDPGYSQFRSCATTFTLLGKYERARKYAQLDENTGFGAALGMEIALRTGSAAAALTESRAASRAGGVQYADLVRGCLSHAPETELSKSIAEMEKLEADPKSGHDPEGLYRYAVALSACGQTDAALTQLRKAIDGNYCSYPAMDTDPLFKSIRQRPEFGELRQAGIRCQQRFLAHRKRVDGALYARRY